MKLVTCFLIFPRSLSAVLTLGSAVRYIRLRKYNTKQNKSKYGTKRATVGESIMIASKIGLFVVLGLLAKLVVMTGVLEYI